MNNKILIRLSIGLILIVILIFGILIGFLLSKGTECKLNPLSFGAERIEKLAGIDILCMCEGLGKSVAPFYFDDKGVYDKNPYITLDNSIANIELMNNSS